MNTSLSIKECLRFGWNTFKTRPGILIGGPLLLTLLGYAVMFGIFTVLGVTGFTAAFFMSPDNLLAFMAGGAVLLTVAMALMIIVGTFIMMGILSFFLKAHDDIAGLRLRDLKRMRPFWTFLGAYLLVNIATQIGSALFIIPGLLVAIFTVFVTYLILDKNLGVFASIKRSVEIVSRNFLTVVLLLLALIAVNILGLLALVIGLFVSIPVSMLAMVHAYRTLSATEMVVVAEPVTM